MEVGRLRPTRLPLLLAVALFPRRTVRRILEQRPGRHVLALVIVAFLSSTLSDLDFRGIDRLPSHSTATTLGIVAAVFLVVLGLAIAFFYLITWIASFVGRKVLDGRGGWPAVRTAMAWATAPLILALVYRIPAMLFWPAAFFALGSNENAGIRIHDESVRVMRLPDAPIGQILILGALETAVIVWYVVVASRALGEAQGFSSWRGFGNLILAVVLPLVTIAIAVVSAILA